MRNSEVREALCRCEQAREQGDGGLYETIWEIDMDSELLPHKEQAKRCVSLQKALHRLRNDLGDETARSTVDDLYISEVTSKQHAALNLPQSDFIIDALSGLIQVVDELRSENYREQYASSYERLVTEAYSTFVGDVTLSSERTYGPGLASLWNWFEGVPEWVRSLTDAAREVQTQRVLSVPVAQLIVEAAAEATPATIAGHLAAMIVQELIQDRGKYPRMWSDAHRPTADKLVSQWLPDHVAWDRVGRLVGQMNGDCELTAIRTALGWRYITTSVW
jgi:hypothetical protein